MKIILVPTDFSNAASNAFKTAISIAERSGAKIILLHVLEGVSQSGFSSTGSVLPADDMDKVYLLKLMEKAKSKFKTELQLNDVKGLKIEEKVAVGSVVESITTSIIEFGIDMVVMGMHGKDEPKEYAGSNTIKIVRTDCPVLVVKSAKENFALRKMLLATDFENITAATISKIKSLKELLGFELEVLYVNTQLNFLSTEEIEKRAAEFKKKYELNGAKFNMVNHYSEEEGIMGFASKINADVIALSTHGRKGMDLFFFGSVSENVVKDSERPILTFKV